MFFRLVLVASFGLGFFTSLQAQGVRLPQNRQPVAQTQPVDLQGVLENMGSSGLTMVDNNQTWRVFVPQNAKVQVTGTAEVDFLRSGLGVEFEATVDDRGTIQERVGELTIVTLSRKKPMGVFPANAVGDAQDGFGVGVEADLGNANKKPHKRAKVGKTVAGTYRIVGRLAVGRGGKLSVHAGRGMFQIELAEQPTISVDVAHCNIARKGDKISVQGISMPARPGLAQAQVVNIVLSEPLTGIKKKRPSGKSSSRPPKKNRGLPEPAVEP